MNLRADQELRTAKIELQQAEAELDELKGQLQRFETQVDTRLGSLLDQLSELNAETEALDGQLRRIREERLFGRQVLDYVEGAPRPTRPVDLSDQPPVELERRISPQATNAAPAAAVFQLPDLKTLYRRLARRYHPDLARNEADRKQSNEHMKLVNQAFSAGDLAALMKLAGVSMPYGMEVPKAQQNQEPILAGSMKNLEQVKRKLQWVHDQITQLGGLPIVKLSLDVKLRRHEGRDLLREMAGELQYKVKRKMAERDYLKAQINANAG